MAKFLDTTVNQLFRIGHNPPTDNDSFGVEIEMEGLPEDGMFFDLRADSGWRAVADGSLRNGIEFISNGPRTVQQLDSDVDELAKLFQSMAFTPVFSYRTSLHVHMNAGHMTVRQLANLWCLYTIFEYPMILMGGEERLGNVHCLPVGDCNASVKLIRAAFEDVEDPEKPPMDHGQMLARLCVNDRRYAAFNWASLPRFNTIEFRSHRGTMEKAAVLGWVNTIQALKTAAMKFPDPITIVQNFSSTGPEAAATAVFGAGHPMVNLTATNLKEVWEGVRLAQELAFGRANWDKAVAKPRKRKAAREEAAPENPARDPDGWPLRVNVPDGWAAVRPFPEVIPPEAHEVLARMREQAERRARANHVGQPMNILDDDDDVDNRDDDF